MRWKRRDGVMNAGARRVQRVYLVLLLHALAASFIWGINTLYQIVLLRHGTEIWTAPLAKASIESHIGSASVHSSWGQHK
jgi:hypothetical protein